jgi:hypothetical protein
MVESFVHPDGSIHDKPYVAPSPTTNTSTSHSHDSVAEATGTSTAQAPLTPQQAEQSKTLPPSYVYVQQLGQYVDYAHNKIVVDEGGNYSVVPRTTSAGTPARIPTSGAIASPVSNQFYSPTPAGQLALKQEIETYNARQQAEAQLIQKVNMANLQRNPIPEQSLATQTTNYEAIGREYYETYPTLAKIKYLGYDWSAIPSAIKGKVTGDYSDYYYGLGKVITKEQQARSEGFFGNIPTESVKFFGGTKVTAEQLKGVTQPMYTAPRWDFKKGSYSEARQKEATPFVTPPIFTGQLARATEFIPFKLALIYGTSKLIGAEFGYADVMSKAEQGGKVVQTVAGVSKASNLLLPVIGAGVGKSVFDVATNPELRTTEKIGLIGGTAVELGTGIAGFKSGYGAGAQVGKTQILEAMTPSFTTSTSKQFTASDFYPVMKDGKLIGYTSRGNIIGMAESEAYGISVRTVYAVREGKLISFSNTAGTKAVVGVRGTGVTKVTTGGTPSTIDYGEGLVLPRMRVEGAGSTKVYGNLVFKSGATVNVEQTIKFRGEMDYGKGLKLPAPYESYSTARIIQPKINYGNGIILNAPKEVVYAKGVKTFGGTYSSKVLQSELGTQKIDVSYSKGELSNIQAKRGELHYSFGESIEKNVGQTYEYGVSKFTKRNVIDITTPPAKIVRTREGYQVIVEGGKNIDYLFGYKEQFAQAQPPKPVPTQQPIQAGVPLRSQVNLRQPVMIPEPPVKVGTTEVGEGQTVIITRTAPDNTVYPPSVAGIGGVFRGAQEKILVGEISSMLNVKSLSKTFFIKDMSASDITPISSVKPMQNIAQIQQPRTIQQPRIDLIPKSDTITNVKPAVDTITKPIVTPITIPDTVVVVKPRLKEPEPQPFIAPVPPKIKIETNVKKAKENGGAYIVMLKRKGKFFKASEPLEKPQALDVLAMKLSRTLGATAKIVPVRQAPVEAQTTGEFARLQGTFRTYKIQKGQRIPMENTYIQEAKYRLGTKEERTEIQSSKRMFGKLFGGFKR